MEITLEAIHKVLWGQHTIERCDFDLMDYSCYDDFEEAVKEWLDEIETMDGVPSKAEDWEYDVVDWDFIHPDYRALNDELFEYVEAVGKVGDKDVVDAAIECDIRLEDIEECYIGYYNSDADFAENLCEDFGYVDSSFPTWIEIDWEATARNLMQDISEDSGYYFRLI